MLNEQNKGLHLKITPLRFILCHILADYKICFAIRNLIFFAIIL